MPLERVRGGYVDAERAMDRIGWRALLAAPVAISAYRTDGRLLFANDAMFELLGHSAEDVERHGWLALLYPDEKEQAVARRSLEQLAAGPAAPVRHQRAVPRADGSPRLLDTVSAPIDLGDGLRGVVTTAVDITNHWLPVGGPGPDGDEGAEMLARFDVRSGRLLFVSSAVERQLGWTPAEILRSQALLPEAVQPEFRARVKATVEQVAQGASQAMVLGIRRRDGTSILVHVTFFPVRDATGKVMVIEALGRDITQVRALERELERTIEELKRRNQELASLDKLKSQLLANVSHELRTPLVSIKGYTELILRGGLGPLTPRQRRGLEIAGANTERLVELIETLLDFARREEGRLTLHRVRFDLRDAVRAAIAFMPRFAARGIALSVELGEEPLVIEADEARIAQTLRALLSNAEKFGGEGGAVAVRARREGARVALDVVDHGIGIPAEARGKIFERFYQVDAGATRAFGGAGLGLALAKEIVGLHGGEIEVSSDEGKGSRFTVWLPLAPPDETARAAGEAVLLVGAAPSPLRDAIRAALEAEGYALIGADGPGDVLRRARRHRPDAVVLAFQPRETGEALDELKRAGDTAAIPVVAVAEEAERGLVGRGANLADLVLSPSRIAELAPAVARLTDDDAALGRPGGRPARVAIVDDEPENLDFTRFVLEREGFEVICVSSGEAALGRIGGDFDLVILDIAMEGLDGIEVCRRMKSRDETRDVPVLVVTAMTGDEIRRGALGAGAGGFLVKPYGVAEFLRQVRLHLRVPAAENA